MVLDENAFNSNLPMYTTFGSKFMKHLGGTLLLLLSLGRQLQLLSL